MSKAVLISIQPKWCELIASGKKAVEVRKSRPKLETPFKVYVYCTQGDALALPCLNVPKYTIHRMNNGTLNGRRMMAEERVKSDYAYANGKVIGEFICDKINEIRVFGNGNVQDFTFNNLSNTCLSYDEIAEYIGRNRVGYSWHISDLKVYDRPRDLSEFNIKRPPQSWQYVEECE